MARFLILLILFPFASAQAAYALSCNSLGRPSYTADRTVIEEGRVVARSRVFVSRQGEREESSTNGQKQVALILGDGTYVYNEVTRTGQFIPKPQIQSRPNRQVTSTKVGPNTQFTEIVPSSSGGQGIGDRLLCSPQGVPLRREYVALNAQRQLRRFVMEHRNVRIGRLPGSLFKLPAGIAISRARGG